MNHYDRQIFRMGWFDGLGKLQEAEQTYTDIRELQAALGPACNARAAAGLPQISVVTVYQVKQIAPVLILVDQPPASG